MNILWHSNVPWSPTGYGVATAQFTPALSARGHHVILSAFHGLQGATLNWHDMYVLPGSGQSFGEDVIEAHAEFAQADIVMTMSDPFVHDKPVWSKVNWVPWAMIDSKPAKFINVKALERAKWIIAVSRFGERVLLAEGFENVLYCPLTVDTTVYRPIDRDEARARMGERSGADLAGKYLIVSNMANKGIPSRKNFEALFTAFKAVHERNPDAVLYLHTKRQGQPYGEDLNYVMKAIGVEQLPIWFPNQYHYHNGMLGPDVLVDAYNAADVYVQTARGEGFGIPLVEAQACGCPVIATDSTAMTELVFVGETVTGEPIMMYPGSYQMNIRVDDLVEAILDAQDFTNMHREMARQGALQYDTQTVVDTYLEPALARIRGEVPHALSTA